MHRRTFIKKTCIACITGLSLSELASCGTHKNVTSTIHGTDIVLPISEFETVKEGIKSYKKAVIVQNESLKYPICVFRHKENDYTAIWMVCTHLGAELQLFGDKLQCPAHGSEFSSIGKVESAPATENLKSFPIVIKNQQLKISLK